jgi:His/Glu/Gln/Arg/opine family amino acid ABC transporter permease subunit
MSTLLETSLPLLAKGTATTLYLSVASTALATLLGLVFASAQLFGGRVLRAVVEIYLYLIRGIPLLVLLFAMYYALPYAGIRIEPNTGGILVIAAYFAAFMTEVFRGAVQAVPAAQWEAGRALGLRTPRILTDIVLVQAFRVAGTPYVNTVIMVVKGTSLVAIIGLADVTFVGRQIVERTLEPFAIFGAVAAVYFVICYALSRLGRHLEKKASYVH